jgi:hypothetical protein
MSQEPMPWEARDRLELRVSHEDREQVAEVLRVAAGDGRLTLEELEERLEGCFGARTYGDLAPLVADLPGPGQELAAHSGQPAQPVRPAHPLQPVQPKDVARVHRVGGNLKYEGAWVAPRRLEAEVRGGNVVLDFTTATVTESVTEVDVEMRGGNLRVVLPEGYAVDASEVDIRGGSVVNRHAKDVPPGIPIVHRIVVTGEITGGNVVVQHPRPPKESGRLRKMLGRGRTE